jgi:membrane protease YdiL (CAAX protease family)
MGGRMVSTAEPQATTIKANRGAFIVLGYVAVAIVVAEYLLIPPHFRELFPTSRLALGSFAWWTGGLLIGWVAVPIAIAWWLGLRPPDLGLSLGTLRQKLWIYGVLYVLVLVPVAWASGRPSFLATYPLIRVTDPLHWTWGLLLGYWLLYAGQFVCLEFFFRGFMIFTLRPRFGSAAIAVMVVPYAMIHFHKPMPEALAAIGAGLVLGALALRTDSIWGGATLHIAVAITMDALAMSAPGGVGWPI